jgi:hypothetical protein
MKELDAIMAEVKKALAAKGKEIEANGCCAIKPVTDAFMMRQREMVSFERSILNIKDESSITTSMIARYRNDGQELLIMIGRIVV